MLKTEGPKDNRTDTSQNIKVDDIAYLSQSDDFFNMLTVRETLGIESAFLNSEVEMRQEVRTETDDNGNRERESETKPSLEAFTNLSA